MESRNAWPATPATPDQTMNNMAVQDNSSSAKGIIDANFLAQTHESNKQLFGKHGLEIEEAIDDSEGKKLVVRVAYTIDCSKGEPIITVDMRFTPKTVTDRRTIKRSDPNQLHMQTFSPEQMLADAQREEVDKAQRAQEDAEREGSASANGEGGESEPEPAAEERGSQVRFRAGAEDKPGAKKKKKAKK